MILKYRGYGQNWIYIDSEEIMVSRIDVPPHIAEKYLPRPLAINPETQEESCHELYTEIINQARISLLANDFENVVEMHGDARNKATVVLVTINNRYLLFYSGEIYLMNDNGKTVDVIRF